MESQKNLIELFEDLLHKSEQMLELTKSIDEETDWTGKLLLLIDKRAHSMKMIDEFESRLENKGHNLSAQERTKINEIIKRIQDIDNTVSQQLNNQMVNLRGKIGSVRKNKKVQDAYLGNVNQLDGWFIDSKK